jgi:hypothetical protein
VVLGGDRLHGVELDFVGRYIPIYFIEHLSVTTTVCGIKLLSGF